MSNLDLLEILNRLNKINRSLKTPSYFKVRKEPQDNYISLFHDGKTIRFKIDPSQDHKRLAYPEFYDVKITGKCKGQCPYCYQDSKKQSKHYKNVPAKVQAYFGSMPADKKPYQVAIGGGEPTLHPEFEAILKAFYDLEIMPNYTTNGMHVTPDLLDMTKTYCGGVAISAHPHLRKYWEKAIEEFTAAQIKTNLHVIISDTKSVNYFNKIYDQFKNKTDYFVLLAYSSFGRGKEVKIDWDGVFSKLKTLSPAENSKIAFGAGFIPELRKRNWDVALYNETCLSAYITMNNLAVYESSFSTKKRTIGA